MSRTVTLKGFILVDSGRSGCRVQLPPWALYGEVAAGVSEPREAADVLVRGNPESRGEPVGAAVNVKRGFGRCRDTVDSRAKPARTSFILAEACNFIYQSRMIY